MKKKLLKVLSTLLVSCSLFAVKASAGTWIPSSDYNYWTYQLDNGNLAGGYETIDGKQYFFDPDTHLMAKNEWVPFSYRNGYTEVWVGDDGVVDSSYSRKYVYKDDFEGFVELPRVVGLGEADAKCKLNDSGFRVNVESIAVNDSNKNGIVYSQRYEENGSVTITVGLYVNQPEEENSNYFNRCRNNQTIYKKQIQNHLDHGMKNLINKNKPVSKINVLPTGSFNKAMCNLAFDIIPSIQLNYHQN